MAAPIVTRTQWGARPSRTTTLLVAGEQKGTAVHYSAAESDRVAIHDDCASRVRAIQNFHLDGRGWADIAYSWLVCHHGFRFEGRGLGVRTAAQGTNEGNGSWHAVCFLGFDLPDRADVTAKAKQAIADCVTVVRARYPQATGVRPHSAFHSTACPGDELRAWITAGLPTVSTMTGDVLEMTEDELRAIVREENAAAAAKEYRLGWRGVDMGTGEVSAPHAAVSIEALHRKLDAIKAALDDQAPA